MPLAVPYPSFVDRSLPSARLTETQFPAGADLKAPVVRVWRKGVEGWPPAPTIVSDPAACLDLPEIGARIGLVEVYRKAPGAQP